MKAPEVSYGRDVQTLRDLEASRRVLFNENEYLRQFYHWLDIARASSFCDFCCGTGFLAIKICEAFPHITGLGIDAEASFIEFAKQRTEEIGISAKLLFKSADVSEPLAIINESYDRCFSFAGLQVVNKYEKAITNMIRITKRGGYIVIFLPIDKCPSPKRGMFDGISSEIDKLEKDLFRSFHYKLNKYFASNAGMDWQAFPKALENQNLINIKIFGLFIPYRPANMVLNEFAEHVSCECNMLCKRAIDVYARFVSDTTKKRAELHKLMKLYRKRSRTLLERYEADAGPFDWQGAPLLVIRGEKQ